MISLLLSLFLLPLCSCTDTEIEQSGPVRYELVVEGLKVPWGMAFLPDGDWLVTERSGDLRRIRNGVVLDEKISGVPKVYTQGQGGLLDIELHPDFANNKYVYLSYSSQEGEGSGGNTAIMRGVLQGNSLINTEVLYKGVPNTTTGNHFGSRLEFDKDGFLYFTIGDRGNRDQNPQDITRDGGKVYRIKDNGEIPSDNPFFNQSGAKKAIYSYGHRNLQGMAMQPSTGDIWTHEHGPKGGDEVNLIRPGKNYGWPVISYGINYNGTSFAEATEKPGMEQPATYWDPSIAPSGMAFVTGDKYPGWEGDLIVGSLKFGYLVRCKVQGNQIVSKEIIAEGIGRTRNVKQGPDGYLYVGVEGKGIYRLIMD